MARVWDYLGSMLPFMLWAVPILALIRFFLHKKRKTKINWYHEVAFVAFGVFMVGLLSQAILSGFVRTEQGLRLLIKPIEQWNINLVPFRVFADTAAQFAAGNAGYFTTNVLGNLIMFMPIGFFVPLLWNNKGLKSAALATLWVSLFIEITQLPQGRATDIDDLWLNVLGGVLGYGIYALLKHRKGIEKFRK